MRAIDSIRSMLGRRSTLKPRHPAPSPPVAAVLTLVLDCPVSVKPRYPLGQTPHARINALLADNFADYLALLKSFLRYCDWLSRIPSTGETSGSTPYWINGFIPGLDAVAIYSMIAERRPKHYFEIGSGNSTKFARQSILDHGLSTRIISIDPAPRAEINRICDEAIRLPLEDCDLALFERLDEGDILFVDNSHRCFMNSDVTVFFLDILPRLKRGVIVAIHDICLPYDYPADWGDRYYSEQYLLACWLLAGSGKFEVLLPSVFVSLDASLSGTLEDLWLRLPPEVEKHGSSFWLKILE